MVEEFVEYFNGTKYTRWYFDIINNALRQQRIKRHRDAKGYVYYERHHIVPKSVSEELANLSKTPENAVLLTAREHILVHWLLTKMFDDPKHRRSALKGFHAMCFKSNGGRNVRTPSVGQLARARQAASEGARGERGFVGTPRWFGEKPFEEFVVVLQQHVHDGLSDPEISSLYGVSAAAVHTWRRKLSIQNRRRYIRDPEWLRYMYNEKQLSAQQIADIAGCTGAAIQQKLKQFGIPVRTASERQQLWRQSD